LASVNDAPGSKCRRRIASRYAGSSSLPPNGRLFQAPKIFAGRKII
jgi:hypothetical protein